jgi:hypothetical protein
MVVSLVEALEKQVRRDLADRPVLVWYDPGGTLAPAVDALERKGALREGRLLRFKGSFLELKYVIARSGALFKDKWLLYIDRARPEPCPLLEFELFGVRWDKTLVDLLADSFKFASTPALRRLLAGERGKVLTAAWDKVMTQPAPPLQPADVERGLLAATLGLEAPFTWEEAIVRLLTQPESLRELARLELGELWSKLMEKEMGLKASFATLRPLAAAALLSEVALKGMGKTEWSYLLPQEDRLESWARVVRRWRERWDGRRSYKHWASTLEQELDIEGKLAEPEKLVELETFSAIDRHLLSDLKVRIASTDFEVLASGIKDLAEKRFQLFWAREDSNLHGTWLLLQKAAEMSVFCQQGEDELRSLDKVTPKELSERYAREDGWWRIDLAYLELAGAEGDPEIAAAVKPRLDERYAGWLRRTAEVFCQAVARESRWPPEGLVAQPDFWDAIGHAKGPLAVLLVDALRYDLAWRVKAELEQRLRAVSVQVDLTPMASGLPTRTSVGMVALLPHKSRPSLIVYQGQPTLMLEGKALLDAQERIQWLKTRVKEPLILEDLQAVDRPGLLEDLRKLNRLPTLIVLSQELDEAGGVVHLDPTFIQRMLDRIVKAVIRLHNVGYQRVTIGTDHGFIFYPPPALGDSVEPPEVASEGVISSRYALPVTSPRSNLVCLTFDKLGWQGDGLVAFPSGIARFHLKGGPFLHGGLSLQEAVLSIVSSKIQVIARVEVRVQFPERVTASVFRVSFEGEAKELLAPPRKVIVEAYYGDEKMGQSEAVEIAAGSRLSTLVRLSRLVGPLRLRVVDTDTEEVLEEGQVAVETAGYEAL